MADRAAIAVTAIIGDQAVAQRLVGIALQHRVEAGPHAQTALIHEVLAEMGDQFASDLLIEIGRAENLRFRAAMKGNRLGEGCRRLDRGDGADFPHAVDHVIPAIERGLVMTGRVVILRPLRQGGEVGAFRHRQLV